jgi:hypothetical protein
MSDEDYVREHETESDPGTFVDGDGVERCSTCGGVLEDDDDPARGCGCR